MKNRPHVSMIGGEIHYGRLQPRYWGPVLDAARQLGVEVLATYIIWDLHETSEGTYDFSSWRAFLAEVEKRGFKLIARPGPYVYSEWRNLGIPDHAVPYHKHHPEFRRKAAHWIAAVMAEIRPYLGQPIVCVQADNEIDPLPHFYGEDMGFADWLKRHYPSVEALNRAWDSSYASFAEAIPTLTPFIEDQRLKDSCQYRYDLATDYARWAVAEYRKNGCTVPILLNTWPGVDAQHWRDLADLCDLYGIDPYPSNECREDYRYFKDRIRLLRSVTDFPYLAEFGSGIWHGMPNREYSPDHYRLTALTALAGGVRGWNWYMLADRDNWYRSPINERGVARPELAPAFTQAVNWFRQLEDTPPPETSFAVTWSWHYHQIAQLRKKDPDDPLFAVLHDMGIEYDYVDVDRDFTPPKLLLAAGRLDQPERLWHYVQNGGNLVLFQQLIEGCPRPDGTSHPGASHLEVSLGFVTRQPVFNYREVPGAAIVARQLPVITDEDQRRHWELATGRTYLTGYWATRGKGKIIVLGCAPSRDAILAVLRFLDINLPVLPLTPGVHAARRGKKLIVVNPGEAKTAKLQIDGQITYVDLPRCSGIILG
ncbi:MAG TPA: beta-galactosidase [Phycisphaerae bacterium]|nr:beta-galactosidase [Phycisphaerae bacterium]HRY69575.1 beta-galactosidase [Phycisphaerae bacterium]HSA29726.1 beta-galactosidase [Phycisphaerae bacterium]